MYYDLTKVLSYNAFLNFIIGSRGTGKTYGITKFVINKFLKTGSEFVYIRRYKSEIGKAIPKFFDAIIENNEFNCDLKTRGNTFYCNDKICGHAVTLSTAQNYKGTNFSKVKYIIFDEFIPEGGSRYLKNEVEVFLGLIESIARTRDVNVFCLGNSVTITNEYFIYFDINQIPYKNDIKLFKNGLILLNYVENTAYTEFKKETKFGKLVSDTLYSDYAIDNKFRMDNKSFIERKKGSAKYYFAFINNNVTYGVWFDYKEGKIYISKDYYPNSPTFSCTMDDGKPNTMFLSVAKKFNVWRTFIENYKLGNVYYESQQIKNICVELFKNLIRF